MSAKTRTQMIGKIVDVLALLATMAQSLMAKAKSSRRQRALDELQDDPLGWFTDHFGGMPNDADAATKTGTDDHRTE
jgi:hypothetical protein